MEKQLATRATRARTAKAGAKSAAEPDASNGAPNDRPPPLRDRLLVAAEQIIVTRGLAALKARDVANQAGCALGAIYTAFADLDELILRVNLRTLERLEAALDDALGEAGPAQALNHLARAYLSFARRNEPSWRALFEHRLPLGGAIPDWYSQARNRLFSRLEAPLAELLPQADPTQRALLARTLFSAVHGVVILGLEEKIVELPSEALEVEVERLVGLITAGLEDGALRARM